MLELVGADPDAALIDGWRVRVARARFHLGWPDAPSVVRPHAAGASLAIEAPFDLLFLATEINEWALCATLAALDPGRGAQLESALRAAALEAAPEAATVIAPVLEEAAALARFSRLASAEARPGLRALIEAAGERGLPTVLDEELLTLGAGEHGRTFPLAELPAVGDMRWSELGDIPIAIVTGSNGKTTTVRLIAAAARAHGLQAGFNCTDGVVIGTEIVAAGDYSGPAGARLVLRDTRTAAAVLETARGGILRRGIALERANVAVVTNVSSDHFGEYGIDDLDGLADVKLSVAALVTPDGLLVLNADDALLRAKALGLAARFRRRIPLGWFALDYDLPFLAQQRAAGGATAGVRAEQLRLGDRRGEYGLGRAAALPLTVGGSAHYNIANLAAAALAAAALGIPAATIAAVFADFGARPEDNPGRLMRYDAAGVTVLVDYAHNPDGLRGFLQVAYQLRAAGARIGLLLGHAGNRHDADIAELARVAAGFKPDLIVIKENEAQLRGRAPGEVPRILRAALLAAGMPDAALPVCASELEAARFALDWARPGDVLALPIHSAAARRELIAALEGGTRH